MIHTFSFDSQTGELLVAAKVYSDFGSHIPLIRSFSLGANWPPEYPLFPGEPIRYHYLFYYFVGICEKIGFRLDVILNSLSALGFFSLLFLLFTLGRKLFNSVAVGVLSVFLFLFNGSFSFLDFLSTHPWSADFFHQLFINRTFPSFAPWNGSLISAFWNLNIYTNQRHLGLSYAICLLLIYLNYFHRSKLRYLFGFIFGSLLLLNQAAFIVSAIFFIPALFNRSLSWKFILYSVLGALPWLFIYLTTVGASYSYPVFHPGYLLPAGSTLLTIFRYWFYNLGLHLFLIPIGFFMAPLPAKKFALPMFILFILPNLFQFSADMINNHKFLNFFLIFGLLYSSAVLVRLWSVSGFGRIFIILFFPLLILGGIVDFFPVYNDSFLRIKDVSADSDVRFFAQSTPADTVVLNDIWFYNPASLAGRKIFNGYSYFTWSYGYNSARREKITTQIYSGTSKASICSELLANKINYVQVDTHPESFLLPTNQIWAREFAQVYSNPNSGLTIYSVNDNCR